jgi:hypothetical protein
LALSTLACLMRSSSIRFSSFSSSSMSDWRFFMNELSDPIAFLPASVSLSTFWLSTTPSRTEPGVDDVVAHPPTRRSTAIAAT